MNIKPLPPRPSGVVLETMLAAAAAVGQRAGDLQTSADYMGANGLIVCDILAHTDFARFGRVLCYVHAGDCETRTVCEENGRFFVGSVYDWADNVRAKLAAAGWIQCDRCNKFTRGPYAVATICARCGESVVYD